MEAQTKLKSDWLRIEILKSYRVRSSRIDLELS